MGSSTTSSNNLGAGVTFHRTDTGWLATIGFTGSHDAVDLVRDDTEERIPLRRNRIDERTMEATTLLAPASCATYHFEADGISFPDPANPVGAGPLASILVTPDSAVDPWWPSLPPEATLPIPASKLRWCSERLGRSRSVRIHQTDVAAATSVRQPLVLLLDGDRWLYQHPAATAFDNAAADGVLPRCTVVFVPSATDRDREYGNSTAFWNAVVAELLPMLRDEIDGAVDFDRIVVAGQSMSGLAAIRGVVDHPSVFGRAVVQSASLWWPGGVDGAFDGAVGGDMARLLSDRIDLSGCRIALEAGLAEPNVIPHTEAVVEQLERCGAGVLLTMSPSGHDPAAWRHALIPGIAWALGSPPTSSS